MSDKFAFFSEILKSCYLPELKQNLDDIPLQNETFSEYHHILRLQLPVLYDFVQQHEEWIFECEDKEIQELQSSLIILLCELLAPCAIYRLNDEILFNNAKRLLQRHRALNEIVEKLIFEYFRTKLQKDSWKRHVGATNAFHCLLEFYGKLLIGDDSKRCSQWLQFSLAVGLNVRECHDPIYKEISTKIFRQLLEHGNAEIIQNLNIHSVVYNAVFKDAHYIDSATLSTEIWNCLYKCLDFYIEIDSFNWTYIDDMLEVLVHNIALASDSLTSICFMKFVTKFCCYFTINRQELEDMCDMDISQQDVLENFRQSCVGNTSYTPFRWAKSILNLFIAESYKLLQTLEVCRGFLQEFHKCYLVCIWPIPLPVVEPHLVDFYGKFTATLMEVIVTQNKDSSIVKMIKEILETFCQQLQRSERSKQSVVLSKYSESFEKLLTENIFK